MKIDPHADEPTVAINPTLHAKYLEAKENAALWKKEADRLKAQLVAELGDAYAGTINGYKLVTYRPEERFNTTQLRKDWPDLTEHFVKYVTEPVFVMSDFEAAHADIAEKYRVRSFKSLADL